MKAFLENSLGVVLTLSIVLGILLPGVDQLPTVSSLVIISSVIFVSGFRINKEEFLAISIKRSLWFYTLRFLLLPFVVWFVSISLLDTYIAVGLFLLTLMPSGIASPAVSGLLGGNTTLALSLVTVTSLLAPFVVPIAFYMTVGQSLNLDLMRLFMTLSSVIFLPLLTHIPFRFWKPFNRSLVEHNSLYSILLFSLLMIVVVAKQREAILNSVDQLMTPFLILSAVYALYYVVGFAAGSRSRSGERVTFAVSSGVNNNALGITLALNDFAPEVALFLVLTSIPWSYGMVVFKKVNRM